MWGNGNDAAWKQDGSKSSWPVRRKLRCEEEGSDKVEREASFYHGQKGELPDPKRAEPLYQDVRTPGSSQRQGPDWEFQVHGV